MSGIFSYLHHYILISWLYARTVLSYVWVIYYTKVLELNYPEEKLRRKHIKNALRYKKIASKFRGGLIKLAQFLSTQEKLLPKEIQEILATMQDDVEPLPYCEIENAIISELGKNPEELFGYFEKKSIASASFGQVHKAQLKTGEIVAVKVQHKNIKISLDIDLAMAENFVKFLASALSKPQLVNIYQEIKDALYIELDYEVEANFAKKFKDNFKEKKNIVIPKIYDQLSTPKVLVMDYIEGYKITDLENIEKIKSSSDEILEILIDSYFQQFYCDGFFHSDPHPGNIFYLKGPKIAFIDFGQSKILTEDMRLALKTAAIGVISSNLEMLVESLIQMGMVTVQDKNKVLNIAQDIFSRVQTGSANEILNLTMDFNFIREKINIILKELELTFPEGISLYGRTLVYLNGLISSLSPNADMFEMARRSLIKRF